MKKILLGLVVCGMSANLAMAEATWLTSLPEAQALAKKENKLVFMDFEGSDWCPPCKKLDSDVFSKPEFEAYAKKNIVLVKVDFPDAKPQTAELKAANKALSEKYKVNGYPTLIVVKPDGTVVWESEGYPHGGLSDITAAVDKVKMTESRS
ncbi:MAG TPA: thioredoxin family protein [Verrucomicrobiae bacterium]